MKIQLVVFDMAGTTVHDENNVHIALQSALQKENIETSIPEINEVMGIPKPVAIRILLEQKLANKSLITEDYIARIHRLFLAEMIEFYQHNPLVKPKENAELVFEKLREKGIKVVLDTGFSRDIVDTILTRLNWHNKIDTSVASDEVVEGRPAPDLILKAMELCQITDSQLVAKVGDTPSDLQEGTKAACKYVIGITTGAFNREALSQEPHTHLIDDLTEVLAIVGVE